MKLLWSPEAQTDIENIYAYIKTENPLAARRVVLKIRHFAQNLQFSPAMGRPNGEEGGHLLFIPRLPCFIYYRQSEDKQTIQILRVYHTAREWPINLYSMFKFFIP